MKRLISLLKSVSGATEVSHALHWALISLIFLLSVYLLSAYGPFLQANLFPIPKHAPFDGLVMPVKQIPNWVDLTSAQRDFAYSQFISGQLIDFPDYVPSNLEIPFEKLKWGTPEDNIIRNQKITYSVPYMGDYRLDGGENTGSHAAIDIKIPEGTPIFATANGVVTKVSLQSSGFGTHIVLQHNDFPSFENEAQKTAYFSSYSHLNTVLVAEGDIVAKGQQIALSGSSGTATTPHLHFQMDRSSAPFHVYWPFTSAEAGAAGLNFFEAINEGLGAANGLLNTVNPLAYIKKYEHAGVLVAAEESGGVVVEPSLQPETDEPVIDEPASLELPEEPHAVSDVTDVSDVAEPSDENIPETHEITIRNGLFEPSSISLWEGDSVRWTNTDSDARAIFGAGFSMNSDPLGNGDSFVHRFDTAGEYAYRCKELGQCPLSLIRVVSRADSSEDVSPTPEQTNEAAHDAEEAVRLFTDVSADDPDLAAFEYLHDRGVLAGYSDGTLQPERPVFRVEAVKLILAGIGYEFTDDSKALGLFSDLASGEWYVPYVSAAYKEGFVRGNPDGTFRPVNNVNIAEFYKMLFLAMQLDLDPNVTVALPVGVDSGAWYAPYIQEAVRKNILDARSDGGLDISHFMTRREIARAMYKVNLLIETGAASF